MQRNKLRKLLIAAALLVGIAAASIGAARPLSSEPPVSQSAPMKLGPFDVARILSVAPPEVVVVTLGSPRRAMPGALAAESLGTGDDELVARVPTSRRIVLAGADPVRTDRLARRLMATGHDVRVLEGGLQAWDAAMLADPPEPAAAALAAEWETYRYQLALRRRFGADDATPAPAVTARPLAAPAAPASPKKREGC